MREFLKGLGLEQETIDAIMAEHGKLLTASTEKITELSTKVNDLTAENLELKKVDAEGMQKQIDDLTREKDERDKTHADELDSLEFDHALELALLHSKTIDPTALKAHLDTTKLKYNKEHKSIEGFEEQLTSIKEAHRYLFESQATGGFQGNLNPTVGDVALNGALKERYEK